MCSWGQAADQVVLHCRVTLRQPDPSHPSIFRSRLVAADFARQKNGEWIFIEAGPGSCAGTAHESVFKAVASRLRGEGFPFRSDAVGGVFEE